MTRVRIAAGLAVVLLLVAATTSLALEKTEVPLRDSERSENWNVATSCTVMYYNTCTGWLWIWSGWSPGDQLGIALDSCCPGGTSSVLTGGWLFCWTGSPSGYGFTGSVDVFAADADLCPTGAPVWTQPYLPVQDWDWLNIAAAVTSPFAVTYTLSPTAGDPVSVVSDHPAAGPTGPPACGSCYPTTRAVRSFYYGTASSVICPGSTFFDGVCDSELMWDFVMECTPTAIDPASWGKIKGLYR
ncbi:MAG: hypothetical protein QF819_02070 [Gemmatimonadota bacterium]|jgi:hypothetical protein|nr:hypothetical protein [Gemmatimonadota bacterium]MDP6460266.1 hypothetical protein [Gemmatimonadota bacterium]MDP6530123.1 hypothetical protein [Gemmatimonadota bacterium]MDP6801949.1 hypothetical protein [Gemmatimonadota bacterium]MDP7031297.1 hypothetical protein [Gemmatimonadota bacterium]